MNLDFKPVRFEMLPEVPEILRQEDPKPAKILFNGKVRVFTREDMPENNVFCVFSDGTRGCGVITMKEGDDK